MRDPESLRKVNIENYVPPFPVTVMKHRRLGTDQEDKFGRLSTNSSDSCKGPVADGIWQE